MKILITDHYSSANRGDAAIPEGMMHALKAHFPDAEFTLLSDFPETARIMHGVRTEKQPFTTFAWNKIGTILRMLYLLTWAKCSQKGISLPLISKQKMMPYLETDIVISKGGGFLNDFYCPGIVGRLWSLYFPKLLRKKTFIYAQSIGPLDKKLYRKLACFVLEKIDLIILRDQKSETLLRSYGLKNKNVYVTADAAFSMPLNGPKPLSANRLEGMPTPGSSSLRISISLRHWRHTAKNNQHEEYLNAVTQLVDWLVSTRRAEIFFLSTCTGLGNYPHDDRMVGFAVLQKIKESNRGSVKVLCNEYTPQELINELSHMNLHIGTRMHSNILAMLAGTPIIGIEYEFKTSELMKRLNMEEYLLNIQNITAPDLISKVDSALNQLPRLKAEIKKTTAELRTESLKSAKLIFEYWNGGSK